jgi:hypothetical protein
MRVAMHAACRQKLCPSVLTRKPARMQVAARVCPVTLNATVAQGPCNHKVLEKEHAAALFAGS